MMVADDVTMLRLAREKVTMMMKVSEGKCDHAEGVYGNTLHANTTI